MKKNKLTLLTISLISFFSIFTSCNGRNNPLVLEKRIEIGIPVSQLDETIWVIYQDKKSNFWFGSKDKGVFYYDGQLLKNITTRDGLVSNEIRGIQEDSDGNIFFETEQGVSQFDGKSFKTLQIKEAGSSADNWMLSPDDLWFRIGFNNNGAYRFDGEYLHFLKFTKSPQEDEFNSKNNHASIKPYGLYTIYKDRKGIMWFGTASLGVCRYDGKSFSWHYDDQLQTTPEGGDFGTRAIFEDKEGKFWINNTRFRYSIKPNTGSGVEFQKEDGIGYFNENNQIEFPFFLSVTEDDEGILWGATYENGVWQYNGKELIHYPIKDGETDVLLFTIFKDNKGILWLGSHNAGVYKFDGQSFEKFEK
jgi:ligand-binding sensor domain-containing protein